MRPLDNSTWSSLSVVMSGNSTHLGISLSTLEWTDALETVWIIARFVAGACIRTILNDRLPLLRLQALLDRSAAMLVGALRISRY